MAGIETQYLEILITGVQERKNWGRDELTEVKQVGQFADGVAIWGGNQVYLSEASQIQHSKSDKLRQDEYKLARAMRDSWVSQVKGLSKQSVPPRGIAVYGSSTFNDETKLWRLDFQGVFRIIHFDSFFVPLAKEGFGKKAKEAILRSLALAIRVKEEMSKRENLECVDHEMREFFKEAVNAIQRTTATPTKAKKRSAPLDD